ncbi:MAG: DNA-directed RNA polymerase [Thermoplasmata archaeon]|nr:DNA-directed RNA polymerase [Thermoplasmata archaeon]
MYFIERVEDVVRIPPSRLGENYEEVAKEIATHNQEGKILGDKGMIVLIKNVELKGEGTIVHGDGGVYQTVEYDALFFKPVIGEVIEGMVVEIMKYGAFVRIGPFDALLHISQIMDDRVEIDEHNQRLLGKETRRELRVGNRVRVRIVAVSLNEFSPQDSRIGLTMRQPGLGRMEWLEAAATRQQS